MIGYMWTWIFLFVLASTIAPYQLSHQNCGTLYIYAHELCSNQKLDFNKLRQQQKIIIFNDNYLQNRSY